ncbi:Male germ cell RacGap [Intoshia linei]|uniref:Male germ cell RacGap n=1 Tax=Intoshia linei TaxID=1819745 RepID=A0A177BBI5_9BILA|nr:Male germ cell RacGap [Intoshia linei]
MDTASFKKVQEILTVYTNAAETIIENRLNANRDFNRVVKHLKKKHEKSIVNLNEKYKEMKSDIESTSCKLNHAREQYSAEIERRRIIQNRYNRLRKQLKQAKLILFSDTSEVSQKNLRKLAFLNETAHEKTHENLDESGSVFSDIDYDRTMDIDMDMDSYSEKPFEKRISKARRSSRHKRTNDFIEIVAQKEIGNSKRFCMNSPTDRETMTSSISTSSLNTLRRCNSGRSLNKKHNLVNKMIIKLEPCIACGKRIKFGKNAVRCTECKSIAHSDCKTRLPLPCVPLHQENYPTSAKRYALEQFVSNEPPFIPAFVTHCVKEIEKRGMYEKEIYRICGSKKSVDTLVEKYIRGGGTPSLSTFTDIHTIASALKKFLRELKEPLLTFRLWSSFATAAEMLDCSERESTLCSLVASLPKPNRDTLSYLVLHLQRIAENLESNTSSMNIARVFGPSMIGYSSLNPTTSEITSETDKQHMITQRLMAISCDYWLEYIESHETEYSGSNSSIKYLLGPIINNENNKAMPNGYRKKKNILGTPNLSD